MVKRVFNLEQKQAVVAEVAKQVAGAQAIVMAENRRHGGRRHDRQLRAKARASGVYFRVVKNTLVRRAVAESPFAALADKMVGPLAYGIGADPVAVAKVLNDFAKGHEKFVITGGAMPGQVMSAKDVACAGTLPSREELIAKLMRHDAGADRRSSSARSNEVPSRFVRTLAAGARREAGGMSSHDTSAQTLIQTLRNQEHEHVRSSQPKSSTRSASMTVLELSELIKAMEDKFGVSAAAAVAVAGPAAGRCGAGGRRSRMQTESHRRAGRVRRQQGIDR